ncbi:MAG TPA: hypothetical protein VGB92_21845 [Longimicrobium sp.]|jgi:hypothetical protein
MLRFILLRLAVCAALLPLAGCERSATRDDGEDPRLEFAGVTTGDGHSCALTTDGEAYCWGEYASGQLGIGGVDRQVLEPRQVSGGLRFRSLHAGTGTTCGLDANGALHCWGLLRNGIAREPVPQFPETRFAGLSPHPYTHTCGIITERTVGCWGINDTGVPVVPAMAPGPADFAEVSVGAYRAGWSSSTREYRGHVCGVKATGAAFCWGDNSYGQLGIGSDVRQTGAPTPVAGGLSFKAVRAGAVSTCGLDTSGALYCWGKEIARVPRQMGAGLRFESLDMGSHHGCAVTSAGRAYCWGGNSSGELGAGTVTRSAEPQAVQGGVRFLSVSAAGLSEDDGFEKGGAHTCGISTDHRIYCWGDNFNGQLGNGTRGGSMGPVPVAGPARDA